MLAIKCLTQVIVRLATTSWSMFVESYVKSWLKF